MAAYPLASEASFRFGLTSLDPNVSSEDRLWREAEKEILGALPSVHLEEAAAIRDKLWFRTTLDSDQLQCVPIGKYLRLLAENYLDENGRPTDVETSNYAGQEGIGPEARLRWCWMCRALPPDLIRAARGVVDGDEDPFQLHPAMLQILRDRGFAETHLHLGSALDFPLVWATLMRILTNSESKHSDFKSPGAYFADGRDLGTWLLYAAVVRLVLATWLFNGAHAASLSTLLTFARSGWGTLSDTDSEVDADQPQVGHRPGVRDGQDAPLIAAGLDNLIGRRLDVIEFHHLATLLSEFIAGKLSEPRHAKFVAGGEQNLNRRFARTRGLYLSLIDSPSLLRHQTESISLRAHYPPRSRDDVFTNDPLALVVGWRPTMSGNPEILFIKIALNYLEQNNQDDDFARLFWQLMRIRCLLYRHLVERPLTPGLQWFMRFFSRIKPVRKKIPGRVLFETAARLSGKDAGLRALEVRLGTEENEASCLAMLRAVEGAGAKLGNIEIGAVFHFSRKRGGGWEQGRLNAHGMDHSYPATVGGMRSALQRVGSTLLKEAGNPTGYRFARFYIEQRRHAQALVNVIQMYPRLLRTIRGIDLCTDEAGVPVWVMLPLMRWVREAGQQALIKLKRRGESAIPPLQTSVHAGEDFVHLMAGLRRIDHTVTYLNLEEGDRLGHALALGVEATAWCGRTGRVIQTSEERLFDLVWEWSCYAKHNVDVASKRLAYVRTEIVRLAHHIFGSNDKASYAPEDMMAFFDLVHKERELRNVGFPDQPVLQALNARYPPRTSAEEVSLQAQNLLLAYLCEERVWRRGRSPETVNFRSVQHEGEALSQLQNGLRRRIGALGLTIEVNPSSNVVIGDLGHLEAHPLWRLRPVESGDKVPPLSICIGSDNPLTLATTLPHEYQLLFDALVLRGHSHEVAMNWIDGVREAGLRTRFTLPCGVARIKQKLEPNILTSPRPEGPP
jgi:hypothetical protein